MYVCMFVCLYVCLSPPTSVTTRKQERKKKHTTYISTYRQCHGFARIMKRDGRNGRTEDGGIGDSMSRLLNIENVTFLKLNTVYATPSIGGCISDAYQAYCITANRTGVISLSDGGSDTLRIICQMLSII